MTLRAALDALHRAGRIRVREMTWATTPNDVDDVTHAWRELAAADLDRLRPAHVGCLAALAREASGDPTLHLVHREGMPAGARWFTVSARPLCPGLPPVGPTEGAAWAAALVAMAEGL